MRRRRGRVDGYVDAVADGHSPWDYLGGLLVCTEAGAVMADAAGRPLAVTDPAERRQLVAAATPELLAELPTRWSAGDRRRRSRHGPRPRPSTSTRCSRVAVAAAHAGGEIVRAAFGSARGVHEKGPGD